MLFTCRWWGDEAWRVGPEGLMALGVDEVVQPYMDDPYMDIRMPDCTRAITTLSTVGAYNFLVSAGYAFRPCLPAWHVQEVYFGGYGGFGDAKVYCIKTGAWGSDYSFRGKVGPGIWDEVGIELG
jgi:hypothetical protein